MIRRFVRSQRWLSTHFDRLLPERLRIDGNQHFVESLVPRYLKPGLVIYDVGGGKNPFLDPCSKETLSARVTGIDIDASELSSAPVGAYDEVVCADISRTRGQEDGDLIICQALLEHVGDVDGAFQAIASLLRNGGHALIFVPNRNALFARLNRMIPESTKRVILFGLFPSTSTNQGFPAFYDRCTPRDFRVMAEASGLEVVEAHHFFVSSYFSFFFPAYLTWRAWSLVSTALTGVQASETFSMVLRKGAS